MGPVIIYRMRNIMDRKLHVSYSFQEKMIIYQELLVKKVLYQYTEYANSEISYKPLVFSFQQLLYKAHVKRTILIYGNHL